MEATRRLAAADLADNPELIYHFDLSELLKSATRIGNYAHFMSEQNRLIQAEELFHKALKQVSRPLPGR
jgi:hypothetical protein